MKKNEKIIMAVLVIVLCAIVLGVAGVLVFLSSGINTKIEESEQKVQQLQERADTVKQELEESHAEAESYANTDGGELHLETDNEKNAEINVSSIKDLQLGSIIPAEDFNKKKVSISTVGLGDVDERFLSDISGKTGGLSVTTDNVEALGSAMASVVRTTNAERNLLSARAQVNMNFLYVIMRIVFVTILGVIFIGIKIAMTDESVNTSMIIISSLIACFLGAVILEIGLEWILSGFIARLILVFLISLTITTIEKVIRMEFGYGTLGRL
ncbi:hypothetical protein F170042I7_26310 [Blautia caecimuris]|uniref:hypothetical protein n=1 Tax=Blautia caecimuris TaxID=1796615 RepID=UPI00267520E7|nr:hypothetical protein [uncultured Blautia sp.]